MMVVRPLVGALWDQLASQRSARNVVWNFMGGASTGVLMLLATPWFVARLGMDGYGLVGLWLALQVLMGLVDMGLGTTTVKAMASAPTGAAGESYRRDLVRTLEVFYFAAAGVLTVASLSVADWVSVSWLSSDALPVSTVREALRIMALALGLQFPVTLFSSGLAGLQSQGRLNALQIGGNILRYGGAAAVLLFRADLIAFFVTQAIVAGCMTLLTRHTLWRLLAPGGERAGMRPDLIPPLWRYAAGMAATSVGAVLMGNIDRLALSKLLPTSEMGKYSVAFTATGLLQLGIQPFYRAFFPRYAELIAAGRQNELRTEYYTGCRLVAAFVIPAAAVGIAFAPELIFGWLGYGDVAISRVFQWLLLGIASAGLMWLPAALQQASGWTRLHAGMIAGVLVVGAPIMVWLIRSYGVAGATVVWVLHGVSGLTLELWLMHRRLLTGELWSWYRTVLLPPAALAIPVAVASHMAMPSNLGRWTGLAWALVTGLAATLAALTAVYRRLDRNRSFAPSVQ